MGDWTRSSRESQRVLVPPSRHISTSFQEIVDRLSEYSDQKDVEQYRTISEQMDFAALHDFQLVRRRLKESFKPFNDAALHHKSKIRNVDAKQADSDEVEFLEDLYALLNAAHFRVLSAQEWEAAVKYDFTFTNPMDVSWDSVDNKMLTHFWQKKQEEYKSAAALSDRFLIMHRGIKLSHAKDKFFQEKIDLLVEYLIADPLENYVTPYLKKYKIAWRDYWPVIEVTGTRDTGLHKGQKGGENHNMYKVSRKSAPFRDPLLKHENARWVTRQTLKDVMPNCSTVFQSFFKEIHLQEPTFRDAIILYRRNEKPGKKPQEQNDFGRNIFIKRFQDIPNADLEMVFPDKKVYLKPVLLLQLLFTIVLGLISVLITILTSEATWSVIGGLLSVIGTRAYQVYSSATLGRQKVLDDITDRLYDQTMDAQDGVIYFLLDQMADQHVKELLLAYFLLLDANRPMTQKQLDKKCEEFLASEFGEKVDFALENSLPTLIQDGLIQKDGQGHLRAISLEETRKILAQKGASFFNHQERSFKSQIPTFARLSSRSLQKYMKPSGPNQSQPSNLSSGSAQRPVPVDAFHPPKSDQYSVSPDQPSDDYPRGTTQTQRSNAPLPPIFSGVETQSAPQVTSEGLPGNSSSLHNSGAGGLASSKPVIEYEDEDLESTPAAGSPPGVYGSLTSTQMQGEVRPRVGHAFDGASGSSSIGPVGNAALQADESRL